MSAISNQRVPLDRWLADQTAGFPAQAGIPYPDRLAAVSKYMRDQVHPHVEKGALVAQDGFLTDHGPKHIDAVARCASELLGHPTDTYPQLTAYEVYFLLMAIHFHDVGNLYGRSGHEQKLEPIMAELKQLVGHDMVERRAIMQIARAHGGHNNGDKDTIVGLPENDPIFECRVRYRALAAILRLADELSDDSRRTSHILQKLDVIPPKSHAFHLYSNALQAVAISAADGLIDLRYYLTRDQTGLLWKGSKQVYLLDEIYQRTVKMHYEREYCTRFTRDLVHINAIDVTINIHHDQNALEPCIEPITYRLQSRGYPGANSDSIDKLVPSLHFKRGAELYEELRNQWPSGRT